MKKLIMTAAVLACAASVVAQTVTSANIVGYNKAQNQGFVTKSGLTLLGVQFDTGTNNTPTTLFGGTMPYGTTVYKWNPPTNGYSTATFNQGFFGGADSWSADPVLSQSEGFWVEVPSNSVENIISGEVELAGAVTNTIQVGLQLLSNPYPTELVNTNANFVPAYGDTIYKWNAPTNGYTTATYNAGFFGSPDAWSAVFTLGVGEGFWYESVSNATDWILQRPFTP